MSFVVTVNLFDYNLFKLGLYFVVIIVTMIYSLINLYSSVLCI